ncbi:hemA [Symbiodinium sp. CCMP2592]|nr:hemA [Symbiodinium sp. CCMP2592]
MSEFVPKIAQLQQEAELLRSGELKEVLQAMKELRKPELRSAFGEVDQLLCALVSAIDGLREHAQSIRRSELREQFHAMDRSAQDWVGKVEKDAVESLTGFRADDGVDTMMEVHVVGLSHHSAPVEVREKLAVAQADWNAYAQELVEYGQTANGYLVPELAVLSTCNRFELYFASPEIKKFAAVEAVRAFLSQKSGIPREELEPYLFSHSGEAATQHLFEVSSGLDSLVLGEAQILSQVKACHEHAIQKAEEDTMAGCGGKIVSRMLNAAIRMGKMVRTRTKIGKGSVSVSSAAVELMMSRAMQDLRKPASKLHVCIIGAGKMSRLLLLALFSKYPDIKVSLVNRSVEKAQEVLDDELVRNRGGSNAEVVPLEKMFEVMRQSDVTFTATGSKVPIIQPEDLQDLERNLMLVDISVPLNVAPGCEEVDKVASYSVDDLKKVVQANAEKRQSEVDKARRLITDEVQKFKCWQASQGAVPYLAALQAMAEQIRRAEYAKMEHKLRGLQDKEKEALDKLTRHIVDQLFRPVYYSMKERRLQHPSEESSPKIKTPPKPPQPEDLLKRRRSASRRRAVNASEVCEEERRSPTIAAGSFRPATTLYLGLPFAWRDLQEMAAADEKLLNAPARDDADVPIPEVEPPESSA